MARSTHPVTLTLMTPRQPGAVALIQLHGPGAGALLSELTQRDDWPPARLGLCDLAGIDTGLAVRLRDDWAQLMPHGGPRVAQRIIDRLIALGARYDPEPEPLDAFPEATSGIEAEMLATIAQAASPAAIELLAQQPRLWRHRPPTPGDRAVRARSDALDRLITPATIVVVGRANVGKSTLTNTVLGKAVSVVADLPGTTRDWVGGVAELACRWIDSSSPPKLEQATDAIAVRWMDTPGLRGEAERLERRAIELARQVIVSAEVLIAMRDPATPWPEPTDLPREPDIWVINKIDDAPRPEETGFHDGESPEAPLPISAERDRNVDHLGRRVLATLGLEGLALDAHWAFSPTLRRYVTGPAMERAELAAYLEPSG